MEKSARTCRFELEFPPIKVQAQKNYNTLHKLLLQVSLRDQFPRKHYFGVRINELVKIEFYYTFQNRGDLKWKK